ncbi:hypothetical protein [Streptomyces sp. NPDC046985]|uniref:hypothetical protein n=1 Tax=Streptomyces sp. NPDC046985 TaxID=3155377 RepID=UPI003403A6F4
MMSQHHRRATPLCAAHGPDCVCDWGADGGAAHAWRDLYETCCLSGWESRNSVHDPGLCRHDASA